MDASVAWMVARRERRALVGNTVNWVSESAVETATVLANKYCGRRRALDTILNEFAQGYQGSFPVVAFPEQSLAGQRRHHLVGRRMPADL